MHNKIDLDGLLPRRTVIDANTHLWLSARTGAGLALLIDELRRPQASMKRAKAPSARAPGMSLRWSVRQHICAPLTIALVEQRAGELAAEELRGVQRELGAITGEFSNEDLLGRIFADFCIGK